MLDLLHGPEDGPIHSDPGIDKAKPLGRDWRKALAHCGTRLHGRLDTLGEADLARLATLSTEPFDVSVVLGFAGDFAEGDGSLFAAVHRDLHLGLDLKADPNVPGGFLLHLDDFSDKKEWVRLSADAMHLFDSYLKSPLGSIFALAPVFLAENPLYSVLIGTVAREIAAHLRGDLPAQAAKALRRRAEGGSTTAQAFLSALEDPSSTEGDLVAG